MRDDDRTFRTGTGRLYHDLGCKYDTNEGMILVWVLGGEGALLDFADARDLAAELVWLADLNETEIKRKEVP
jgi:hypothetical protein